MSGQALYMYSAETQVECLLLHQDRKQVLIKINMQRLWPWQVKATRQPYISQYDCSPVQSPAGLSQLCRYASIFKLALTEAFRPKYILTLPFLTQCWYERKHFYLISTLVACVWLFACTCVYIYCRCTSTWNTGTFNLRRIGFAVFYPY